MKIIDVSEFYSEQGGGVRTYVRQKLAAASSLGHEIVIVAPGPTDREEQIGRGRIRWIKSPQERLDGRYYRFDNPAKVHAVLDRESPDVVEASSPWKGGQIVASWSGQAQRVLVLHNDPVAVYAHSFFDKVLPPDGIDKLCTPLWRKLANLSKQFDSTIVAGSWLAQRFTRFGVAGCQAIPFGVEKEAFSPKKRSATMRQKMLAACGIRDERAPLFIAVSRHHPEKRVGVLIDAMARIGHRRPAGLFLVGDGPLRGWVERIAAQIDGVCVAGAIEQSTLSVCLASADAMMHAGAAETFGLAIAEGLCAGLPMVLPDRGGANYLAGPHYSESYAAGDADDCAAAAERLLTRNREDLVAGALRAAATRVQSSHGHFTALFQHYEFMAGHVPLSAAG